MNDAATTVIVILVVAFGIVALILYFFYEYKRKKKIMELASSLGFNFTPHDIFALPVRFSHISLFKEGHSRRAKNIIYGTREGASVFIFEYFYTTGSGKNQKTHSFTVCSAETETDFPYLWIRKERFFDRLASLVGFDDIDFESNEFSKQFYVKSDSKKFAYEVVNQKTMQFLLEAPTKPFLEMFHNATVAYLKGRENASVFLYLYNFVFGFLSCIPDFVLEKYSKQRR
ncbi:MAG: hypothetical protein N2234_01720 [Planctomycetota bacterium]|nr:hypothetical protein [Planctomycetota bacterium]